MEFELYTTYIDLPEDSPELHAGYLQHKAIAAYVDKLVLDERLVGGDLCSPTAILIVRIALGIAAAAILYTKLYGGKIEIPFIDRATSVWILQKISKQLKIAALVDRFDYYQAILENTYASLVQFFSTYSLESLLQLFEAKNAFVGAGILNLAGKSVQIAMTATDFYEAVFEIVETTSGFKNITNVLCIPVTAALYAGTTAVNVSTYLLRYIRR